MNYTKEEAEKIMDESPSQSMVHVHLVKMAADALAWREIAEKAITLAAKWEKEAAVYRANIEEAEAKGLQSNEMRGHKTQLLACAKELRKVAAYEKAVSKDGG